MQNRIRSDPYRTTLVCIDSAQEGLLTGRVYHPYLPSGAEFKNLMQFLLVMARIGNLAGGKNGREFPQRAGVGSAHAQCHQSGGHAQPGPDQRLSRRSGPTVRFVGSGQVLCEEYM